MKKSLTELSEKELLEIISSEPSSVKIYTWPNDVMDFISVYNLKNGKEFVTTQLLYKLYRLWSQDPVKRKTFANTLTDLFPSSSNGRSILILLDKTALNLKQEAYNYVKKQDKRKYKGWLEHFDKYLHTYCIEKGSFFIKDSVLYSLYSKLNYKRRPLGIKQFNNFCKMYLPYKLIKRKCWFGVNESIKNHLTEDLINEMRKTSVPQKNKKIKI